MVEAAPTGRPSTVDEVISQNLCIRRGHLQVFDAQELVS